MSDLPWIAFYRTLITLAQHRALPPVRSHSGPVIAQVYLDWDSAPPTVRIDCLTEIWKIRSNPEATIISHTEDGKLVISPLTPFAGTPAEFLSELSEALGGSPRPGAQATRLQAAQPLLDELDRYLFFHHLLRAAQGALQSLITPADALETANHARLQFMGDDIDHQTRTTLSNQLVNASSSLTELREKLTTHLATEPQLILRSRCRSEFDVFDRDLEFELSRSERLQRAAVEPPRRRAAPPRR